MTLASSTWAVGTSGALVWMLLIRPAGSAVVVHSSVRLPPLRCAAGCPQGRAR